MVLNWKGVFVQHQAPHFVRQWRQAAVLSLGCVADSCASGRSYFGMNAEPLAICRFAVGLRRDRQAIRGSVPDWTNGMNGTRRPSRDISITAQVQLWRQGTKLRCLAQHLGAFFWALRWT